MSTLQTKGNHSLKLQNITHVIEITDKTVHLRPFK